MDAHTLARLTPEETLALLASIQPVHVVKVLKLVSTASLIRRLKTMYKTLEKHERAGLIPAPSIRLGKRRFYTQKEADEVEAAFDRAGLLTRSRFTRAEIADMRRMLEAGLIQQEVADKYQVGQSTISRLVRGKADCRGRVKCRSLAISSPAITPEA